MAWLCEQRLNNRCTMLTAGTLMADKANAGQAGMGAAESSIHMP